MTQLYNSLINRMINLYGVDNEIVDNFIDLCTRMPSSSWNDKCLTILVEAHETNPVDVFKLNTFLKMT